MHRTGVVTISVLVFSGAVALGGGRLGEAFCGADALFASMQTNGAVEPGRALGMLFQAAENLNRNVAAANLQQLHREDKLLAFGLGSLQRATNFAPKINSNIVQQALGDFTAHLGALQMIGDTHSLASAETQLLRLNESLKSLTKLFPETNVTEALDLAARRSCPNHSTLVGRRGEKCWKCGAILNRSVPLLPDRMGTVPQAIVATLKSTNLLVQGKPQRITLRLAMLNTAPVAPTSLIRVHGEKVHLFLLDSSFEDYHHIHPRLGSKPGEYEFDFTPKKGGSYRLWIEAHVFPFAFRQYALIDLPATDSQPQTPKFELQTISHQDGLHYELLITSSELAAGKNCLLKLRVSKEDGSPFTKLEPLMQAYAHLVGFGEDRRSILHTHPLGPPVIDSAARGGPELEFQVLPPLSGYVKWYAQVRVAGQIHMIPFGLKVAGEESNITISRTP